MTDNHTATNHTATNQKATNQRADFLDQLSGLMLCHMMLLHALQHAGLYTQGHFYHDQIALILFLFMPWFYFKGGMFLSKKRPVKEWIQRDTKRLLIPFIAFTIIGSIILLPFDILLSDKSAPRLILSYIASVFRAGSAPGNYALWFLLNLFLARLLWRLIPEKSSPYVAIIALALGSTLSHFAIRLPLTLSTLPAAYMLMELEKEAKTICFRTTTKAQNNGQKPCCCS